MRSIGTLRNIRGYVGDVRGTALVEMGLLILPLTALMVGAVEYGRVFQQFHVASKGVTAAGRYLARVDVGNLCASTTWPDAVSEGDAKDMAQTGFLEQGAGAPTSHILSSWTNHNQITVAVDCANNTQDATTNVTQFRGPAGNNTIPRITVSTSFTYNHLGLFGLIDKNGVEITASHTELYIGG